MMGFGDRMEEEIERKSDDWEDLWGSWEGRKGEIWVKTRDREVCSQRMMRKEVSGETLDVWTKIGVRDSR